MGLHNRPAMCSCSLYTQVCKCFDNKSHLGDCHSHAGSCPIPSAFTFLILQIFHFQIFHFSVDRYLAAFSCQLQNSCVEIRSCSFACLCCLGLPHLFLILVILVRLKSRLNWGHQLLQRVRVAGPYGKLKAGFRLLMLQPQVPMCHLLMRSRDPLTQYASMAHPPNMPIFFELLPHDTFQVDRKKIIDSCKSLCLTLSKLKWQLHVRTGEMCTWNTRLFVISS